MPSARPLRLWLALRIALAATAPLVLVAALILGVLLPHLRANLESRYQRLAHAIAGQIEAHLLGPRRELRALAEYIRNRGYRPAPFWFDLLDAHAGTGDVFSAIYIVAADDSVYAVGLPQAQRGQRDNLLGLDLSQRAFLREARAHDDGAWSETFLSSLTGRLAVSLAIPAAEQALVGEIPIDRLSKFLGRSPAETEMLTVVLDQRGQIIAHSQAPQGGQQLNLGHLSIVRDALAGRFATRDFELDGAIFVGTSVSIPQLDWIVLVAQPRVQAFQMLLSTLWALAVGALAASLLAILVAWALARGLARRIGRYAEQAHAIAEGHYDQPWPITRIREFDNLAGDLNRMSVAIRQREQDLATSEARYRSVIANAPVVIFQFDEHGVFTLSEGKGLARIGLAAGEVVGRSVFELYRDHPETCEYARRAIGGEAFQCVSRTGDIFFEVSYNAVRDRDGHINVTGIAMDITERQQAQEALQESDARLRAAIESVPFDFFLIGANGRYVLQNSASKAHWGNVVGLSPEDVTDHAATLAHWRSNNRKALAGQIVEEEVRATVGDEERYIYNIIAPIKDRDEVRGIVGLNIDITERKRAALALWQSEAKYQRLHESMMDAFVSVDMVGKIQEFNHVYQAMLGYSEDELRTLTYVDLTPEQWRARDMKILEDQILAQGYSEVYEKEYRRKDGTFFPVELRKFLLRDSTNQPIGMWAIVRDITERKRAEEALRQSRNLLQTVLDTIPACVFWKDHDLRYLGCNQAFARDAGANSTGELIGRDDYQLAWREQADLYRSDDRQVLESGTPKIDYEEPQTTPDGRHVWLRTSKVALRDADGVVFGILGTYQDITEHKRAEEAIQRTNRQLRMLSDCNQALIRITDEIELLTTVCMIAVQEGGYRMAWVGYAKRDELKTVRPIAHAGFEESYLRSANITWADDERGRGPIGTAIRTGHPCVVQNIAQDPRMSARRAEAIKHGYAAVCALPLQIGDRIFGALSIYSSAPNAFDTEETKFLSELASDLAFGITVLRTRLERERAEIALRESERKYRELVENANSIILRWSPHGEITFMNEFGLKLFGFSKEELIGQHVVGTIVPLDESTGRNLRPLMEDICLYPERFMHNTNENTRHDGARLWIDWTNKAVLDEHGQIIEIFSVGSDITDRKWAEEELERHREHLEELVTERTAELRQAMTQLVQSEKLAALGNLVAGVAHELNTPLGNARVVATALGEHLREFAAAVASGALRRSQVEGFLGRSREAVDLLERNTARAADLISQFKEVAVDQTSVRRRRFDLRQTVEELLAALRPQFKHTAHRVDLDIPPAIELDSYPGPLEQVITNLVTNSLTHGFAGIEAGTIRIRAALLDPDRVQIDYADDGVGIPEGTLNRIFEPFFTTRLGSGGSGLGLYIVYNLVTGVLGGTIRSHSSVGQGVHFTLVLKATAPSQENKLI